MRFQISLLVSVVVLGGASPPAAAHTIVYTGEFSSEVSGGTGGGETTLTVDTDLFTMRVEAEFSGLSGTTSAAHIHCCTLEQGTGNTGVATVVPSFTDFPAGVSEGAYDFTYDMTQEGSYNPAFLSANGGTATSAFNALLLGLDEQRAYFNIHTSTFPAGEIRAILVPEAAGAFLLFAGLGLLAGLRAARAEV